jgi:hypothetical protein
MERHRVFIILNFLSVCPTERFFFALKLLVHHALLVLLDIARHRITEESADLISIRDIARQ